jgi:hypothetical protein
MMLSWRGGTAIYLLAAALPTSNLQLTEEEQSSEQKVKADISKVTHSSFKNVYLLKYIIVRKPENSKSMYTEKL